MNLDNKRMRKMLNFRYKGARDYIFDKEYVLTDSKLINKAYSQFVWQMKVLGLYKWTKNKMDCDKWAWVFKAYVTLRNALSKRTHALPVGILCYYIDGDRTRPHMINTYFHYTDGVLKISELEPQPNNGSKQLTEKERDSAWLTAF